jgi:RNA polymerase sigma-70 factor (ECF subfamily)
LRVADASKAEITQALQRLNRGDRHAADDLFSLVYDQLRDMARRQFRNERRAHTLQPTALVHKAYLALVEHENVNFEQRAHFFATAAKIMRQLLVDHARAKGRRKRGGDRKREPLHPDTLVISRDEDVLQVEAALEKLATVDSRQAKIVELRFFGGLTVEEVAAVLGVSKRTVEAEWTMIRAWLRKELAEDSS